MEMERGEPPVLCHECRSWGPWSSRATSLEAARVACLGCFELRRTLRETAKYYVLIDKRRAAERLEPHEPEPA